MREGILLGRGREMVPLARSDWEAELAEAPERIAERLRFMSPEHHAVRTFAVRELPRAGGPLPADIIARGTGLSPARGRELLEDLERRLFFLVRNPAGDVSWAFPVTVETTPHHMRFSTGERLYGA